MNSSGLMTGAIFTREAVRAQIQSGGIPADWRVIQAKRLALALEVFSLTGQLLGVALFVFREAILRLLGMSSMPPPLIGLLAFAGAVALLGGGWAVVVGSRSLAGGFNQRLILTPDGFVVDGGPARALPFGDIVRIEQRNWAFLFTRRESLSSGF